MSYKSVFLLLLSATFSSAIFANNSPALTMGWIEDIYITPWDIAVEAKLDSGAKTSSMQAEEIQEYENDGKKWVSFLLEVTDEESKDLERKTVKRKVVREVEIKRHGQPNQHRYVVLMEFCLGNEIYETEFTLTDRDKYNYPVLIGRTFMTERVVLDPGSKRLSEPMCVKS